MDWVLYTGKGVLWSSLRVTARAAEGSRRSKHCCRSKFWDLQRSNDSGSQQILLNSPLTSTLSWREGCFWKLSPNAAYLNHIGEWVCPCHVQFRPATFYVYTPSYHGAPFREGSTTRMADTGVLISSTSSVVLILYHTSLATTATRVYDGNSLSNKKCIEFGAPYDIHSV